MSDETFRSPFEEEVFKRLIQNIYVSYESVNLPYSITRLYKPDFTCRNTLYGPTYHIETKGYFRPDDRAKMIAVKRTNPDVDLRILFQKDNKLSKTSKMKYSDWAQKHGFEYAIGEVPEEWLE